MCLVFFYVQQEVVDPFVIYKVKYSFLRDLLSEALYEKQVERLVEDMKV